MASRIFSTYSGTSSAGSPVISSSHRVSRPVSALPNLTRGRRMRTAQGGGQGGLALAPDLAHPRKSPPGRPWPVPRLWTTGSASWPSSGVPCPGNTLARFCVPGMGFAPTRTGWAPAAGSAQAVRTPPSVHRVPAMEPIPRNLPASVAVREVSRTRRLLSTARQGARLCVGTCGRFRTHVPVLPQAGGLQLSNPDRTTFPELHNVGHEGICRRH